MATMSCSVTFTLSSPRWQETYPATSCDRALTLMKAMRTGQLDVTLHPTATSFIATKSVVHPRLTPEQFSNYLKCINSGKKPQYCLDLVKRFKRQ